MADDDFDIFNEPENEQPVEKPKLGLVTGHPCSSAELEARYGGCRHDDESPTLFEDPESGEVVALMFDRELNQTIEVVIRKGVAPDDDDTANG